MATQRPRLLVLASTFPRWAGDTEPRFVESLSHELAKSFDVVVLAPHCEGAALHEVFSNGEQTIDVHRFRYCFAKFESLAYDGGMLSRVRSNPLRLLLLPLFLLSQIFAVMRLQRAFRIDAIHAHWIVPQGLIASVLRACWRRTAPVLITSHGGDLYALRGRLLERLQGWILGKADAVTVVSNAMRDHCEKRGFAPGGITVQSMGVDLDTTFTPGDGHQPRGGLVFVGRLVEKKGVEYLVEAISILAPRRQDLRLRIVGDGPLRDALCDLARKRGVSDRIQFVGSVLNTEVPDHLRAASIAVMPSVIAASGDQEGLGLVAVEAMGCGCAVVASDLPAVRDTVIDGRTGLMARPEDAKDLAEKIALLLGDEALRKSLAEDGRRHALENFNWPAVGSAYSGLFIKLIASSQ